MKLLIGDSCHILALNRGRSYEGCVRRGLLGLGILGGVGDAMCPWRLNRDGSFEWEKCSSDCKVVGDNQGEIGRSTGLAKKVCPRLRDLATLSAGGITQPRHTFLANSVQDSAKV